MSAYRQRHPIATNFSVQGRTLTSYSGYTPTNYQYTVAYEEGGISKTTVFEVGAQAAFDIPESGPEPSPPDPPSNACSSLSGQQIEQSYNGYYSFSSTLCIGSCEVSSNFSTRYYEDGQWTSGFVGTYTGQSCTGSSGITETTPPALPDCEEGQRPGTVSGQLTCVPDPNHPGNGDDDNNSGGGGGPPGAHEIEHHGPYACIRDFKSETDFELECVFCGVPGTKECEVSLKNFNQLKQPLDKLVESTTEGNKILKDILEELKKGGAGGGSGGGGTGGGGGGTPPGPGGPGGGPGGGGGGADPPGDGDPGEPGSFGGSCGAGFTCSGDAVQCAIAREIHQRGCSEFSAPSCDSPPVCKGDSVQCAIVTRQHELNCALRDTHGLTGEFEAVRSGDTDAKSQIRRGEVDISAELNTTNFLGSGSCVSDYEVSILGQSIVIPFSEYCPFLRAMGAILVVSSLLIAAMIVSAK
ncbi:hypothetical protein [Vandammella animalimorsus]|uniref:hypothetical protein n=1 Tax=Vandammella animalimorsus TaxID=2029117 RepID=UPI001EEDDF42|nr:hypothetical protein [Vandammella animalimorsus]